MFLDLGQPPNVSPSTPGYCEKKAAPLTAGRYDTSQGAEEVDEHEHEHRYDDTPATTRNLDQDEEQDPAL